MTILCNSYYPHKWLIFLAIILTYLLLLPSCHAQNSSDKAPLHIQLPKNKSKKPDTVNVDSFTHKTQINKDKNIANYNWQSFYNLKQIDKKFNWIKLKSENTTSSDITYTQNLITTLSEKEKAKRIANYLSSRKADHQNAYAILRASEITGANFDILAVKALLESDLGILSKQSLSSARGMYQYTNQTWLNMLGKYSHIFGQMKNIKNKEHFDKEHIFMDKSKSDQYRRIILEMRENSRISALINGVQTIEETPILENMIDVRPCMTDYYVLHVLGLPTAKIFYRLKSEGSPTPLAEIDSDNIKRAAKLNPRFFFDSDNNPLTAEQSYIKFSSYVDHGIKRLNDIYANHENMSPSVLKTKGAAPTNSTIR